MTGEKKKPIGKVSPAFEKAPASDSHGSKKRVSRKGSDKSSVKLSDKGLDKISDKNSEKSSDKFSDKSSEKSSEKAKSSSPPSRRGSRASSAASMLQDMARAGKGSLLTTRTSPSSPSSPSSSASPSPRTRASASGRKKASSLKGGYWQGQMLLASPAIGDTRFERSVIYLCHQGEDGALGLVVNKVADKIQFTDVLDHLNIPFPSSFERLSVHVGGPVESSRGFVLHSPEKMFAGSIELGDLAMTASADILKQIAEGKGPKEYVFLLGYAGWGTGQLDKEIERNAWLHLPFDRDLVFGEDDQDKWSRAMQKLGVSPHLLSGVSGNA